MTFDTLTMAAVHGELQEAAVGARVQRIIQPQREEVVLTLYHRGEEYGLLLSCHPQRARVHLTRERIRGPEQPPPFCMLLRKYLLGARITAVSRPPLERVLRFRFTAHEGLPAVSLIAEIMGRRSNLLLLDDREIILGAIQTATREQNPRRAIMPGHRYAEVPPQDRLDPTTAAPEELAAAVRPLLAQGINPERALLSTVAGVSPLAARELLFRSGWDGEDPQGSLGRLSRELRALFGSPPEAAGASLYPGPGIYAPYPLRHLQGAAESRFESINALLDHFYRDLAATSAGEILRGRLRSRVNRRRERLSRKMELLEEELRRAGEAGRFRVCGETLLTHARLIRRGEREVLLPDLANPGETITIALDPSLDAVGNAQKYFRRYRKITNSRKHLQGQIAAVEAERAYCEGLLFAIEQGDPPSLEEIREELVEAGLIKPPRRGRRRSEAPRPLTFSSSAGTAILVGRNNRQNDHLTFKLATGRDTWLHARGLPGSHVIIRGGSGAPGEEELLEAALLAAHFSRGRDLPAVAVDYTAVRHLRRAPGGRPGFVLYNQFRTLTVDPRDERIRALLERES